MTTNTHELALFHQILVAQQMIINKDNNYNIKYKYNEKQDAQLSQRDRAAGCVTADFLQVECIFNGNRPFCVFEAPFAGT